MYWACLFPPLFFAPSLLSLYSTRMQNTWRWGVALGNAPDARLLRWGYQHVGIFWRYSRRQYPTPMLKFALPPTPTPDASQWNIGGVGSVGVGACVGRVHFMLFMSISFASGTQRKPVFWWNMGFRNYTKMKQINKLQAYDTYTNWSQPNLTQPLSWLMCHGL